MTFVPNLTEGVESLESVPTLSSMNDMNNTNTIDILPMIGQVIVLTTTWGFNITGIVDDVHRDTSITMRAVTPSRRSFKEVARTYALDYEVRAWRAAKEGFDFNPRDAR